jgi:hypothetical protein
MTHDRVLRFIPEFDSLEQAQVFGTAQAMAWIGAAPRAPAPSVRLCAD